MSTFFEEMKLSFKDVPITDGKVSTDEFLQAAESLIKLFGEYRWRWHNDKVIILTTGTDLLGSSAFAVVQNDMKGNVDKIRKRLLAQPATSATLQDLILSEAGEKSKNATQGLLWLTRGLEFTAQAMRETVDNPGEELTKTFTNSYSKTLTKYHSMLIRPVFKLAMKACPYRKDFFAKLGADQDKVNAQLKEWLEALEKIVQIIMDFFASGNYGKGL